MGNCIACGRWASLDGHTDECRTCKLGEGTPHPDDRDWAALQQIGWFRDE